MAAFVAVRDHEIVDRVADSLVENAEVAVLGGPAPLVRDLYWWRSPFWDSQLQSSNTRIRTSALI